MSIDALQEAVKTYDNYLYVRINKCKGDIKSYMPVKGCKHGALLYDPSVFNETTISYIYDLMSENDDFKTRLNTLQEVDIDIYQLREWIDEQAKLFVVDEEQDLDYMEMLDRVLNPATTDNVAECQYLQEYLQTDLLHFLESILEVDTDKNKLHLHKQRLKIQMTMALLANIKNKTSVPCLDWYHILQDYEMRAFISLVCLDFR